MAITARHRLPIEKQFTTPIGVASQFEQLLFVDRITKPIDSLILGQERFKQVSHDKVVMFHGHFGDQATDRVG